MIAQGIETVRELIAHGGVIMAVLLSMSVLAVATLIFKLWHHVALGVGRHAPLIAAMERWDSGDGAGALARLRGAKSHLAPVLRAGITARMEGADPADLDARLTAEAESRMDRVESQYRLLEFVGQSAPLLGLLGTVHGMVVAFQAMEASGGSVDPATLAGGIWVALLATTAGLAIALPVSAVLVFLDGRANRERLMAERIIQAAVRPGLVNTLTAPEAAATRAGARHAA